MRWSACGKRSWVALTTDRGKRASADAKTRRFARVHPFAGARHFAGVRPLAKASHSARVRPFVSLFSCTLCLALACLLGGCGGNSQGAGNGAGESTTDGPAYEEPASITPAAFDAAAAIATEGGNIDVSHVAEGYVAASATNASRLKFQIACGQASYNYDLPGDGTPIVCPLNMGDGAYTFRIMQNTSGNNYVEVASASAQVSMASEFEPWIRPNVFCSFTDSSACVQQARDLAASAANEGDVVRAIYGWVVDNITYDNSKASELASATGYVPDPDQTLRDRTGICFDYASLAAAMLRSLGIPCQVITGYVEPDSLYHAWNMVYINGSWVSVEFSIQPNTWTRMDLTFAAAGAGESTGDGTGYTDRYVY